VAVVRVSVTWAAAERVAALEARIRRAEYGKGNDHATVHHQGDPFFGRIIHERLGCPNVLHVGAA